MNLGSLIGNFVPIVLAMSLFGCSLQDRMLYYPEPSVPSKEALAANHLQFWPSGPEGYRGFIGTEGPAAPRGTIVVFHGNAGTAADRLYYLKALEPLGYRVILAEYPRYGRRGGELGEGSFVADARESIRMASQYGGPLYLLGESLGCAVAAGVASNPSPRIDGVLLITPWDTLKAVAKSHFPFLPVGLFLRDRYDSGENLKTFPGRIAVVGAERDEIVPVRHAEALYRSLPGPNKRMWTLRGVGHNDWLMAVGPEIWREFMAFLEEDAEASRPRP